MNGSNNIWYVFQGVCTEAGMYALRERRVHVTQEDFELAVAKASFILWFLFTENFVSTGHSIYSISMAYILWIFFLKL